MPTTHYIYIPLSSGTLSVKELDQAKMRCLSGAFIAKGEESGQNQETDCILCFETLHRDMRFRELPCHHIFHKPCIDAWLSKRDASCPLCRQTFYHLKRPQSLTAPGPYHLSPSLDFTVPSPLRSEHSLPSSSPPSSLSVQETTRQATAHCRGPWEVFKWWRRHRQRRRRVEYLRDGIRTPTQQLPGALAQEEG
ncbi:hypothetical protein ACJ73_03651 [Blastomyces percursus]|uniref:RING-type domain-containing protein n=1 Tax=Blastomyces percursus TaxID=1658174 RepID=A0A1J9R8Z3_9EURO|nr:hypothetical protein ACJ73_03651 [Blastomyces percursus]